MENELKTEFDVIILGTGFTESLVAAAAARIGKKVLHLDRNCFYGGGWASFSLSSLEDWAQNLKKENDGIEKGAHDCLLNEEEKLVALSSPDSLYYGVEKEWHIPDCLEEVKDDSSQNLEPKSDGDAETSGEVAPKPVEPKLWSKQKLKTLNRKFNIDLAQRGALVELLISSNVARYVEFKCITRVLTWMEEEEKEASGRLVNVPCCRSDVFTTDVISLIEKRLLMKFLEFCYTYEQKQEEWADYSEKPFREFLESKNLTPQLIHFITSAIGMVDEEVDCNEGLRKTSLFLNSLGRYGTMPFLFTLYGSGEMPQAFCRLCAVFEGVYILRREVENLIVNREGAAVGIVSEGQRLVAKNIVMDVGYAPQQFKDNTAKKSALCRGVFITDKSIMDGDKEHVTIVRMPSTDNKTHTAITVIELGSGCAVCPKGTHLTHFTCGGSDAKADLRVTAERLFNMGTTETDAKKPNVLFSLYFNQVNYDLGKSSYAELPSNVYISNGPDGALDYDEAIHQARSIFSKIFPDEEFLPRAPDHNDIVFDAGEESQVGAAEEQEESLLTELEGEAQKMTMKEESPS